MENKEVKVDFFPSKDSGIVVSQGQVMTFEVQGVTEREDIRLNEFRSIYGKYASDSNTLQLQGGYHVPMWGNGHNLYPQEVYSVISENKLLPEVIDKQVRFLFGKGPRLYKEEVVGENEKKKRVRIPYYNKQIENWLESWEEKGYEHWWDYLKNLITDYYHVKTCVSQYNFNRSRRIGKTNCIDALTYIGSDEARLATKENSLTKRIKNRDCKYVIVGDWLNISGKEYGVYNRFDPNKPFVYPTSIAFNSEKTFTKWVYSFNDWFKGLYEWIKASNLTPRYLNSYLKNALNAHVHVIIPAVWCQAEKTKLQGICDQNIMADENTPLQKEYKGVKLIDDTGKPYRFFEAMIDDVISNELRKITSLMTGEGKNQGKLYATQKYGDEGWEFKDFPTKFQEFFKSVIDYDKRADQVILAGKGISSSITNVENDGVISKSGSDVYYNYLIYVATLTYDEYFITKELNRAIHLNFPFAKKENIKVGFWIDIPAKQQETTASQRLENTATAEPQNK